MGHEQVRTPNLDRLASQSLTFTRGYVPTGLCRPSLASIINGRWPHEHGIVGNDPLPIPGMANRRALAYQERCRELIARIDRYPTLLTGLKPLGYTSFQCGKWWEGSAERGGFDEGMTHGDPERGGRHGDRGLEIGRQGMEPLFDFIDRHQQQPFVVWYAPFLPHEPHNPPQRLVQRFLDAGVSESQAKYWASVDWFDETCGALLDHLDERNLADDTIVVYVTDNGWIQRTPETQVPEGWRYGFAPLSKQSPNESGVRTPIMIRWPDKIEPHRDDSHLVSSIDLVPTLLRAVGAEVPSDLPGIDLLAAGSDEEPAPLNQREAIFGESYLHDVDLENATRGLLARWCIEDRWKLILSHDADVSRFVPLHGQRETRVQLYDLLADPHETKNLAANHPEVVERLRKRIDKWWKVTQPPVINQLPDSAPAELPQDEEQKLQAHRRPAQPNVLLIMSDDQGYGDIGAHGNTMIRTPRLDELARQSFRLTNFHVDPTCSETRSALMTGRYSCRVGVWHTIQGRSLLDPRYRTMADHFAQAGYQTGVFGKWHLGDAYPLRPQDRGFQRSLIHGGGGIGQTPDHWGNRYFDPVLCEDGHWKPFEGYCTEIFVDAAIDFINDAGDRPFFCYVPTNVPHGPYEIHAERAEEVAQRGVPKPMNQFYAMIEHLDGQVGRLLDCLEEQGVAENTIVIFMTDNGTAAGVATGNPMTPWAGFSAQMRGQKGSQYDGGHRVPCFIRWPAGGVMPGESSRLTAHFDLLPTLNQWCNLTAQAQDESVAPWDGISLASLIVGQTELPERTLVVHSQRQPQPQRWHKTAVMAEHWRLVDGQQLYDLRVDPEQKNNVAEMHPDKVRELTEFYDRWWADVSPQFAEPVRMIVGAEASPVVNLTGHDWHGKEIPWHQGHIREDAKGDGFWALQAARDGLYRVTLRMRPEGIEYRFAAGKVRMQVGEQVYESELEVGSDSIQFEIPLGAGPFNLQTWVQEEGKVERGAYFASIERL